MPHSEIKQILELVKEHPRIWLHTDTFSKHGTLFYCPEFNELLISQQLANTLNQRGIDLNSAKEVLTSEIQLIAAELRGNDSIEHPAMHIKLNQNLIATLHMMPFKHHKDLWFCGAVEYLEEPIVGKSLSMPELFSYLDGLFLTITQDGVFTSILKSNSDDLAMPPNHFIGKHYQDVLDIEPASKLTKALQEISEGKKECVIYYSINLPGKGLAPFTCRVINALQANILLHIRKSDENHAHIGQLKKLYQFTEVCNQAAQIGYWELEMSTNDCYWSNTIREILQVSPGYKAKFMSLLEFIQGDEMAINFQNAMNKAMVLGEESTVEIELKTPKDELRWVRLIAIPIQNPLTQGIVRVYGTLQDITQGKLSLLEIEHQKNIFQTVYNHIDEALFLLKVENGRFIYQDTNPAHQLKTGLTHDILLNKDPIEALGASLGFEINQKYKQVLEKKASVQYEELLELPGGTRFWHTKLVPIGQGGQIEYILGSAIDITEFKANEERLIASETKYKSFIENTSDIIFTTDLEGRFTYISPNIESKLGYLPHAFIGQPFAEIIYFEDRSRCLLEFHDLLNGEAGNDALLFRIPNQSGNIRWFATNGAILLAENHVPLGLLGFAHDITEQILTQNELKNTKSHASKVYTEYHHLLNSQSVYIAKIDINGCYNYLNEHALKTFYPHLENAVGLTAGACVIPEDQPLLKQTFQACFSQPGQTFSVILRYINIDGNIAGSKWEFKLVTDNNGNPFEILATGFDITELLHQNNTNKELLKVSHQQNVKLRSFAQIVSHHIRSHAANLITLTTLLKLEDDITQQKQLIDLLDESASRLNETITNLNEILSIESDTKTKTENCNLLKIVQHAWHLLESPLKQAEGEISVTIEPDLTILGKKAFLESVVYNLLANSIRYRNPSKRLLIHIFSEKKENTLLLHFQDNGVGLDLQKYGHKIFGLYQTFHGHQDARGYGLYLSKQQLEAIGASIEVHSAPDEGATFTIQFPDSLLAGLT